MVLLVSGGAILLYRFAGVMIGRLFRRLAERSAGAERERRLKTLGSTLRSMLRYTIIFVSLTIVLSALGVPTASILAGAGIVGLAVGFGAQNLVRDVISGFFIMLEDQYGVGDFITVAGVSGVVEEVGLRVTKLRDFSGDQHTIPNGIIDKTTNHTRGDMRAMVDVTVAYEENLDRVIEVLNEVCAQLAADMQEKVREGPTVLGPTAFGNDGITVRMVARAQPMMQWEVERELRRRIKAAFDAEGIEIPYARRVYVPVTATKIGKNVRGKD